MLSTVAPFANRSARYAFELISLDVFPVAREGRHVEVALVGHVAVDDLRDLSGSEDDNLLHGFRRVLSAGCGRLSHSCFLTKNLIIDSTLEI